MSDQTVLATDEQADDRAAIAAADATTGGDALTEAEQEAREYTKSDLTRIVQREIAAERRKAEAKAKQEQERKESEARGEYQKLLSQLERERDEAQATLRRMNAERAVESAARKAQAEHPEVVMRLIRDDLQFDDEGNPTNVDTLIGKLKKEYPRYFVAVATGADGGKTGSPDAADMNQLIRRAARRG